MSITVNSIANTQMQSNFQRLATGSRINSASDDAAGLAISEKLLANINGLDQGMRNTQNMSDLVSTAEGGLSSISSGLERVRELTVQAGNGILNASDRSIIQREIDQIMEGIGDQVSNLQFNNRNLLDGSFENQNTASGADGTGQQISIPSVSVESLGLDGFSVTSGIDLTAIDNAISQVNSARADLGAMSNRMDSTIQSSSITLLNLASARSRIVDTDMARASSEVERNNLMQEYRMFMQRSEQQQQQQIQNIFTI